MTPDDSLVAAWELMARGDIHHLPVAVGRRCVSLLDDRVVATTLATIVPVAPAVREVMPARVQCILRPSRSNGLPRSCTSNARPRCLSSTTR